jgi:AbrB family looped-hinge helix DNA binding protein
MEGIQLAAKTKMTSNYRITIPKEVRVKTGVKAGDEFRVMEKGNLIVLQRVNKVKTILDFAGCWQGYPEEPEKFMEDLRKLWATTIP